MVGIDAWPARRRDDVCMKILWLCGLRVFICTAAVIGKDLSPGLLFFPGSKRWAEVRTGSSAACCSFSQIKTRIDRARDAYCIGYR